jgi:hypothetical protein
MESGSTSIISDAKRVLGESRETDFELTEVDRFTSSRNVVIRCKAVYSGDKAPESFIIKKTGMVKAFHDEWAALTFLRSVSHNPPFAPHRWPSHRSLA